MPQFIKNINKCYSPANAATSVAANDTYNTTSLNIPFHFYIIHFINSTITSKGSTISSYNSTIYSKVCAISTINSTMSSKVCTISSINSTITSKGSTISSYNSTMCSKVCTIPLRDLAKKSDIFKKVPYRWYFPYV